MDWPSRNLIQVSCVGTPITVRVTLSVAGQIDLLPVNSKNIQVGGNDFSIEIKVPWHRVELLAEEDITISGINCTGAIEVVLSNHHHFVRCIATRRGPRYHRPQQVLNGRILVVLGLESLLWCLIICEFHAVATSQTCVVRENVP